MGTKNGEKKEVSGHFASWSDRVPQYSQNYSRIFKHEPQAETRESHMCIPRSLSQEAKKTRFNSHKVLHWNCGTILLKKKNDLAWNMISLYLNEQLSKPSWGKIKGVQLIFILRPFDHPGLHTYTKFPNSAIVSWHLKNVCNNVWKITWCTAHKIFSMRAGKWLRKKVNYDVE